MPENRYLNTSVPSRAMTAHFVLLAVFGIAMGLLEAIVVVYLRELYFPDGFRFPLRFLPERMLRLEILRELSTIVMLVTLAALAARKPVLRFTVFLFSFGVWDIFYYVFLKILLDWPQSLFTWDVLFLIPVTWAGPVLAPVVSALTMIGTALLLVMLDRRYGRVRTDTASRLLMAAGAGLIVLSFVWDYAGIIFRGGYYRDFAGLAGNDAFRAAVASFLPGGFHWGIFGAGEFLVALSALTISSKTMRRHE